MTEITFQKGDRVDHIQHGQGTVLMCGFGSMIKVQFDNPHCETNWVYINYCTKLDPEP